MIFAYCIALVWRKCFVARGWQHSESVTDFIKSDNQKNEGGLPQIYPPQEESVGKSAGIYHGDTERKRLLEISFCQTQILISNNDLLWEKDGSQIRE